MLKNKFKVLFIYPNVTTGYTFSPAIEVLSSFLKQYGQVQTSLIHVNEKYGVPFKKNKIINIVEKENPNLIAITATTFEYKEADIISRWIKESEYDGLIVLGGIHATITPHDLKDSSFDAFCIGEGEKPLLELINKIENKESIYSTKSFWFKKSDKLIKNEIAHFYEDLNDLPFHDFDIVNTSVLLDVRNGWLSISFSRGCPYNCKFCINPVLRKINNIGKKNMRSYLRIRDVDIVIEELLSLIRKYGDKIKVINLDDDLILVHKNWLLDFCKRFEEEIYKKYGIKYVINTRVDIVTDELIKLFKTSGCHELKIGVESGNDELRNDIVGKNLTREQIVKAFNIIRKYKVRTCAYFILGLPNESEETISDTIGLLKEIKPTLTRMTFLQPYEGTYLYDYCKEHKLFKRYLPKDSFTESPLEFDLIDDTTLLYYKLLLPWHLNSDVDKRYKKLLDEFRNKDYDELLNSNELVMKLDNNMSEFMEEENKDHFRYFTNNLYYYEYKEVNK